MTDSTPETNEFNAIRSGQLPGAELIFGLVGAVGADLGRLSKDLKNSLEVYGYEVVEVRLSELIERFVPVEIPSGVAESERINLLMTAGNNAREKTKENAILALAAVSAIYTARLEPKAPAPNRAYVIRSLKHPDEVNVLRRVYGNGFFQIGAYVSPEQRKDILVRKGASKEEAEKLLRRDEAEGLPHGQRTRDTFHLSDFFVHLGEESPTRDSLRHILEVLFAHPYKTPLFDEYAMYLAFAAATRTADLSRQIGAVIALNDEVLATGVNECPKYGGGTYWPFIEKGVVKDSERGRDYTRGFDSNDMQKSQLIEDAISRIRKEFKNTGAGLSDVELDIIRDTLRDSQIDDITEYGRVVHAEMDALLTCARNNISCRGATLYTTTFPCHNCAKHIIAAGIKRVVYIEPYPKSKALEFHDESACVGFIGESNGSAKPQWAKVVFEPFVGIGPRRFFDLFSTRYGSGFTLKRKNSKTGKILEWKPENGNIRIPMLPWSYLEREEFAVSALNSHLQGGGNGEPGEH